MKTNFHMKSFALSLALTMRFEATRKWPIQICFWLFKVTQKIGNTTPLKPGQTDGTLSNIAESNIGERCCTVLNEVAKQMQHV